MEANTSTEMQNLRKDIDDLKTAQAVQAATQAGAVATMGATQAGAVATMGAAQAGTVGAVIAGAVGLVVGLFLGLTLRRADADRWR
jgi:uncharacterized membrane protein